MKNIRILKLLSILCFAFSTATFISNVLRTIKVYGSHFNADNDLLFKVAVASNMATMVYWQTMLSGAIVLVAIVLLLISRKISEIDNKLINKLNEEDNDRRSRDGDVRPDGTKQGK